MKNNTSFGVKAALLASMILSSQAFAQSLPDEINHTQYLRIYQNLEQVLSQKVAEFNKLNDKKIELEKQIAQMEKDQTEIPARNAELRKLIENNQQEISRINGEIQGLEGVLGKIIEDLRRLDNIIAQLQRDVSEESERSRQIQIRRNQVAQDVAQLNARLQREVNEENQSQQVLARITSEMNGSINRRQELDRDRAQLIRDVDRFKVEIVQARNAVNQNNASINSKRPQLNEAQAKLPGVKAELAAEEAKVAQVDQTLNPKKTQLNALRAELARLSPDIARLQNENKTHEQKIAANQRRIDELNQNGQIQRRDALEAEVAGVKNQITANTNASIALQEKIKPVLAKIQELTVKLRETPARAQGAEHARLKAEIEALNNSIAAETNEIRRLSNENQRLAISIAPKQNEINNINNAIKNNEAQIAALRAEINALTAKIAENNKKIAELSQSNAGLSQQIAALEVEVKALEAQRAPAAQKAAALKQQEVNLSNQINALAAAIQKDEAENVRLNARIAEMEKTIVEFPQTIRRLEANIRQLDEKVQELRSQIDREQRLLARIRQDRLTAQAERDRAQSVLDQVNQDLASSERLIGALRNKLNEENRNRESLARYNQDSIRKLDGLKAAKIDSEKEIAAAQEEIKINDQDISTIARELPKLRSELGTLNPQVASAENARNTAQTNVNNANSAYQVRLSLFQKYLTEAQALGAEKASIGAADGSKAGTVDAKAKANKLGSENAGLEGKWEAIRRAYVRGEISGFKNGFDIGMASAPDAERGDAEGKAAGSRRAKDHANMVIKPERYLQELDRRLREDETSGAQKAKIAALVSQELSTIKAMSRELQEIIPDLSQEEIAEAQRIISSLDSMIAQSDIEIDEILKLRNNLSQARNVYTVPGAGENANNANCSAVYKGVKDFVEACKGSYVIRYQNLYSSSHLEAFNKEYGPAFKSQIERVFESELSRLYPVYLKEASNVGREVGISTGKKEIYQQSYNRAENNAYNGNLPAETARVENEAANLVQEHLNQNAALALKGSAKLSSSSEYGIAPGVDSELKLPIKNVGAQASQGNSFVRITEISGNLTAERREAPLASVAGRTHADLSVLKIKVSDSAVPGSRSVIAGEIVHPGHHYRSNRVETFRIENTIAINPSADTKVELDMTPKVSGIFGTKKQEVDITIKPKFAGVDRGYETIVEEVGTQFVEVVSKAPTTEVLGRGQEKKVRFVYKLSKAARGQTVSLKVSVKNEGRIVYENTIQIKPE